MKKNQNGFGIVELILIIIVVAILGALGCIAYSHFNKKAPVSSTATKEESSSNEISKTISYKTYTTDIYNVSFKYPATWTLSDPYSEDQGTTHYRAVSVNVTTDQAVRFTMGDQGIGGSCDMPSYFQVIDTTTTSIPGQKVVSYSLILTKDADGTYEGTYGLTDYYGTLGDYQACPNTLYYLFSPTNTDLGLVGFSAKRKFANLDEAKTYVRSDEYAAIKKMITSLTY